MSRPSFRPRPIDLNKPLPIIKTNRDLKHDEDNIAVARALPAMATGVDPTEEEERHLQQALLASIYGEDRKKSLSEIPIPVVKEKQMDTSMLVKFEPPAEYINFDKNDEEIDSTTVEYELDRKDERFMKDLKEKKQLEVDPNDLELTMDRLEKMQGRPTEIIPYSVMKGVLTDALPPTAPDMLKKEIYVHWMDRRTIERKGRPFLRLLQPPPELNDPNPAVAFRQRDDFPFASGRARQARQNTYENFRKLVALRHDFDQLKKLVEKVQERETIKKELSAKRVDASRLSLAQQLHIEQAAAVEAAKPKAAPIGEKVVTAAPTKKRPYDSSKDAIAAPTRKKRKPITPKGPGAERIHTDSLLTAKGSTQAGIDQFSFDEKGRAFLRQMRYIAGLFATHGVNPYDHRVFAAAAERVLPKDAGKDPSIIDFPSQVQFAVSDKDLHIRARPRMGRLGRVYFDPVVTEKQPRVTTYAATSTLGGAYTGGVPFEKYPETIRQLGEHDTVTSTFRPLEPQGFVGAAGFNQPVDLGTAKAFESTTKKREEQWLKKQMEKPKQGLPEPGDVLPFYAPKRKSVVLDFG